jgi:hypothetical protein
MCAQQSVVRLLQPVTELCRIYGFAQAILERFAVLVDHPGDQPGCVSQTGVGL